MSRLLEIVDQALLAFAAVMAIVAVLVWIGSLVASKPSIEGYFIGVSVGIIIGGFLVWRITEGSK